MGKPVVVIDKGWYRRNRVSRQLKTAPKEDLRPRRPRSVTPCPSQAELSLQEWRKATTSEHMARLSEDVSALQFDLCADCLQERTLRAVPKREVRGSWLDLTVQDVLGVCQPCRKAKIQTHELHTRGQDVLILDKWGSR